MNGWLTGVGGLEFDSHHHTQPFQKNFYSDWPNIWAIGPAGMGCFGGPFGPINGLKWAKFINGSGLKNSIQPATITVTGFESVRYLHGPGLIGLLHSQAGSWAWPKCATLWAVVHGRF